MELTGKKNGNGKQAEAKVEEQKQPLPDETKKEIVEQQAGAVTAHAKGKAEKKAAKEGKAEGKADKKKGKLVAFVAKPVPEAVKSLCEGIEKVADLENLKAVARVLKRHWKKVYVGACKKATEGLKAGSVVWFKKGGKLLPGKVIKVKSNGKVKIEAEDGKTYRCPGTIVHRGKPTGADRAEATGSKVTKKAA